MLEKSHMTRRATLLVDGAARGMPEITLADLVT